MINGLHHVAIATNDADGMLEFYRDLLGLEVVVDYTWEPGNEVADRITALADSSARGTSCCVRAMPTSRSSSTYLLGRQRATSTAACATPESRTSALTSPTSMANTSGCWLPG